ncbi:MAG: GxxExxY protein [Acidobacteria bacterium]|nr:GxxExxY protein [Acidobacteriota bacterium]
MNTDERGYFDDAMTERAPGAIFEVSNTLGAGFLEKVYQRALLHGASEESSGRARVRKSLCPSARSAGGPLAFNDAAG